MKQQDITEIKELLNDYRTYKVGYPHAIKRIDDVIAKLDQQQSDGCEGCIYLNREYIYGHKKGETLRKNLEYLIYYTLQQKLPLVSIGRGKEMLGFKTMDEMREWRDNYYKKLEEV